MRNQAQHTPGPWATLAPAPGYRSLWEVRANDSRLLKLDISDSAEADAKLIAAAPELVEALRKVIYTAALGKDLSKRHHGACLPELEEIIRTAKAAISKAGL